MKEFHFDEKILLKRVSTGDRAAFNQLYKTYIENIYNYIYLMTKSNEQTEELLQEVFVGIWENREKLVEIRSFKNYVFKAAKNRLINHIRHNRIKDRVFSELSRDQTNSSNTTDLELTYKEYYNIVQEAIEKLPPKRKDIFKMHIEEGASHAEIAEQLNISITVVKKQFYKGCHFVRQYLYTKGEILSILLILPTYFRHFDLFF